MSNSVFNKHKTSTVYCVIDRIKCRQNETKIKSIGFIRFWKCFDIGSCNGLMPSSMVFLFIFFRFLLFSHEHLIHWLLIYILLFVCAPYQSCWLSLLAERVFDSHLDSNKVTTSVTPSICFVSNVLQNLTKKRKRRKWCDTSLYVCYLFIR